MLSKSCLVLASPTLTRFRKRAGRTRLNADRKREIDILRCSPSLDCTKGPWRPKKEVEKLADIATFGISCHETRLPLRSDCARLHCLLTNGLRVNLVSAFFPHSQFFLDAESRALGLNSLFSV